MQRGAKWSVLLTQYCAGDKIDMNEMGWACGAYGSGDGGQDNGKLEYQKQNQQRRNHLDHSTFLRLHRSFISF